MRSKCRSIATFHRPIHSHWSLPLNDAGYLCPVTNKCKCQLSGRHKQKNGQHTLARQKYTTEKSHICVSVYFLTALVFGKVWRFCSWWLLAGYCTLSHRRWQCDRIRDILVRIRMRMRILGSVPLTNRYGCGCGSVPKSSVTLRMQKIYFFIFLMF